MTDRKNNLPTYCKNCGHRLACAHCHTVLVTSQDSDQRVKQDNYRMKTLCRILKEMPAMHFEELIKLATAIGKMHHQNDEKLAEWGRVAVDKEVRAQWCGQGTGYYDDIEKVSDIEDKAPF